MGALSLRTEARGKATGREAAQQGGAAAAGGGAESLGAVGGAAAAGVAQGNGVGSCHDALRGALCYVASVARGVCVRGSCGPRRYGVCLHSHWKREHAGCRILTSTCVILLGVDHEGSATYAFS